MVTLFVLLVSHHCLHIFTNFPVPIRPPKIITTIVTIIIINAIDFFFSTIILISFFLTFHEIPIVGVKPHRNLHFFRKLEFYLELFFTGSPLLWFSSCFHLLIYLWFLLFGFSGIVICTN